MCLIASSQAQVRLLLSKEMARSAASALIYPNPASLTYPQLPQARPLAHPESDHLSRQRPKCVHHCRRAVSNYAQSAVIQYIHRGCMMDVLEDRRDG